MNAVFKKSEVQELLKTMNPADKVMLVGDHGVYLMGMKGRKVVYAEGCNPDTDEDFYDNKRDIFGGDDGADEVGTAGELGEFLTQCDKHLIFKLTPSHITRWRG